MNHKVYVVRKTVCEGDRITFDRHVGVADEELRASRIARHEYRRHDLRLTSGGWRKILRTDPHSPGIAGIYEKDGKTATIICDVIAVKYQEKQQLRMTETEAEDKEG